MLYHGLCSLSFSLRGNTFLFHWVGGGGGQEKICLVQFKLFESIYPSPLAHNHSQLPFLFLPFERKTGCTCSFILCVENVYQLETLQLLILKDFRCKLLEA